MARRHYSDRLAKASYYQEHPERVGGAGGGTPSHAGHHAPPEHVPTSDDYLAADRPPADDSVPDEAAVVPVHGGEPAEGDEVAKVARHPRSGRFMEPALRLATGVAAERVNVGGVEVSKVDLQPADRCGSTPLPAMTIADSTRPECHVEVELSVADYRTPSGGLVQAVPTAAAQAPSPVRVVGSRVMPGSVVGRSPGE